MSPFGLEIDFPIETHARQDVSALPAGAYMRTGRELETPARSASKLQVFRLFVELLGDLHDLLRRVIGGETGGNASEIR
jgi:hypothetical protein